MNRNGFDDFDLFVTCEELYNEDDERRLFFVDIDEEDFFIDIDEEQ